MTPEQMTEPGSIILTADEVLSVLDAIDYAANDHAYRGDLDDITWNEPEEADHHRAKADGLSALADRLRERAGIEVDRS